jgi:hypothetical protein
MALSAELDALVALIQDPAAREARRKELIELSENGLRQSDYSRRMNELAESRKQQEEAHKKNLGWYDRASKQFDQAQTELRNAQERVAALESVKGSQDNSFEDDAEIRKQLKLAELTAADAKKRSDELASTVTNFNKMIEDGKLITAEKYEQDVTRRGDALGAVLLDIIDLQSRHVKEYGTDLDRKALLEETQKRGGDLKGAYEAITSTASKEKLRKDIEKEVEAKYAEKMKNSNLPIAQGGEPTLGPLQTRIQKKDVTIPDDVAADGSGRMAALIASELRAEGKM